MSLGQAFGNGALGDDGRTVQALWKRWHCISYLYLLAVTYALGDEAMERTKCLISRVTIRPGRSADRQASTEGLQRLQRENDLPARTSSYEQGRWCAVTSVRRGPGHRDGRRGMIWT